jgi:excisionase family DNA binding protein
VSGASHPETRRPERRSNRGRWLSIDAACKILGVDQSTLRRWSDSGKIPVFRTPGGHRRYSEDDLQAFVSGEARPRRRMSRQLLTTMSLSQYEHDYILEASKHAWYHRYDNRSLVELRVLGRQMVELTMRFVTGRGDRDAILAESRELGYAYGSSSARAGLPTLEAVEAFLFFRRPVIQAITRYIQEESIPNRRAATIINELTAFIDEVLLATIQAHEQHARQDGSRQAPP